MANEWPDFESEQKKKAKAARKSGNSSDGFVVADSDDDDDFTRPKKKQQKGLLFGVDVCALSYCFPDTILTNVLVLPHYTG